MRNISDTARWAAMFRAEEADRPDALFRDPFARRLAGERGEQILESFPTSHRQAWSWASRTWQFDRFIEDEISAGCDMVVNLAAGLDARPYRMSLPPSLIWVEVDLPDLIAYKEKLLAGETPVCKLERVRLDLADVAGRCELFARLGERAGRVMVITEGLLIYMHNDEVAALARDLAAPPSFHRWALDLASPGMLRILQKNIGARVNAAGAPFKFGPLVGPRFFAPHGWHPLEIRGLLKVAAKLKRLPWWFHPLAWLPESGGVTGSRPWGGVCLMERRLDRSKPSP